MTLGNIIFIMAEVNGTMSDPVDDDSNIYCIYEYENSTLESICKNFGIKYDILDTFVDYNGDRCLEIKEC